MKLNWEDTKTREARLWNWHPWFAWHPVRIGPTDVRWLETVERRGQWEWQGMRLGYVWVWNYRTVGAA